MPSNNSTPHIVFSVGDASADQYIADLVPLLQQRLPGLKCSGLGGGQMQAAGIDLLMNIANQGIIGIVEAIRYLPLLRRAWRTLTHHLRTTKPDLLILVDYSGFNLKVARFAKQLNIKVLYYISPQIWAWKPYRLQLIRQYVDHIAVILPFEKAIYQQAQVPVSFVGHPLVPKVKPTGTREQLASSFGLHPERKTIGLLPGSRRMELKHLLPTLIDSASKLREHHPDLQFIMPVATTFTPQMIQAKLPQSAPPIQLVPERMYDVLACCDAAIVASGTATLETALMGVPQVIIYKGALINYWFVKYKVLKQHMDVIQHLGLCNIVAGKAIAPELFQHEANPTALTTIIRQYLEDDQHRQHNQQELTQLREQLAAHTVDLPLDALIESLLTTTCGVSQEKNPQKIAS